MDIGSLFLILAIVLLIALYIIRPFFERNISASSHAEQDISTLLAQRDQAVATIQELDDDYRLGKIPLDNYPSQRLSLLQNGANILRQIDTFQMAPLAGTAEDRLEAAISSRRLSLEGAPVPLNKNGNAVPPVPDDELEQRIASRRRTMHGKAGGFCPKCGRPVQGSDRFCPRCGASLVL